MTPSSDGQKQKLLLSDSKFNRRLSSCLTIQFHILHIRTLQNTWRMIRRTLSSGITSSTTSVVPVSIPIEYPRLCNSKARHTAFSIAAPMVLTTTPFLTYQTLSHRGFVTVNSYHPRGPFESVQRCVGGQIGGTGRCRD